MLVSMRVCQLGVKVVVLEELKLGGGGRESLVVRSPGGKSLCKEWTTGSVDWGEGLGLVEVEGSDIGTREGYL